MEFEAVALHPLGCIGLPSVPVLLGRLCGDWKPKNGQAAILLPVLPNPPVQALVRFREASGRSGNIRDRHQGGDQQDRDGGQRAGLHCLLLSLHFLPLYGRTVILAKAC